MVANFLETVDRTVVKHRQTPSNAVKHRQKKSDSTTNIRWWYVSEEEEEEGRREYRGGNKFPLTCPCKWALGPGIGTKRGASRWGNNGVLARNRSLCPRTGKNNHVKDCEDGRKDGQWTGTYCSAATRASQTVSWTRTLVRFAFVLLRATPFSLSNSSSCHGSWPSFLRKEIKKKLERERDIYI